MVQLRFLRAEVTILCIKKYVVHYIFEKSRRKGSSPQPYVRRQSPTIVVAVAVAITSKSCNAEEKSNENITVAAARSWIFSRSSEVVLMG